MKAMESFRVMPNIQTFFTKCVKLLLVNEEVMLLVGLNEYE